MPILSTIIWLPIVAAVLLAFFPRDAVGAIKGYGLFVSLATFVVSLGILSGFQEGYPGFQLVEMPPCIPQWGFYFSLFDDAMSLWLVVLATVLPLVFLL